MASATKILVTTAVTVMAMCASGCSDSPGRDDSARPQVASLSDDADAGGGSDAPAGDAVEVYLAKQQAYVDCIRDNGFSEMHDPDEFGLILLQDMIKMEGELARQIMPVCGPIIEGNDMPSELRNRLGAIEASQMTPEQKQEEMEFATCMQENGVPEYPDPQPNGLPREPEWETFGSTTPTPPGLPRAKEACLPLRGGGPQEGSE